MADASQKSADLQNKLDASEEIFRLLVESVRDYAIYMIDPDGKIVTWNEGARRINGYEEHEAVGRDFSMFYPPEERDTAKQQMHSALESGSFENEGWKIKKDGTRFWASIVITPVYEKDRLVGFSQVTRDLTERKLAGQSKTIFRLLVGSVKDYAIFMLDPTGHVLTWNEGAQRIKGYKSSEIIGKHFSTFYTEEAKAINHPQNELEIAKVEGRYEESGWRVRKDGSQFWANVVITPVYDGGALLGFAKITRDLTERKLADQKEEVFKLLVSGVGDYAIFMLTPEGNVLTWNEGAQRIKGYKADEIIGKHFSIFYTKEAQKRQHPQKELEIARAEGRYEEEGWRMRKDGSLLWANVVITAIYDEQQLIGFAKVTRDLTQRLLSDQERESSAKLLDETNTELRHALEIKSRFLSTISHEVRTPMGAIIGMAEVLTTEDLGEDINTAVANIFVSSQRLLQLLNNLLDAAKLESGEVPINSENFPVRSVLGDIRQLISRDALAKNLRIVGTCDAAIPETVVGDEVKVRQILLNLAHNAVKFTEAGEVNISAELLTRAMSKLTIRFKVSDTGIGINQSDKDRLFLPFTQVVDSTKRVQGGTGLGLSISKQLAERMGGTLGFESEFGQGSSFWFDIPFGVGSGK
ncbi:MAG TPA: PAS domain S-box protein [Planktothrix sp.]|jgi:PAS domain S-box-containing protein